MPDGLALRLKPLEANHQHNELDGDDFGSRHNQMDGGKYLQEEVIKDCPEGLLYQPLMGFYTRDNRLGKAILKLPDPRNELLTLLEDRYAILWDVEKGDLRFSIWNLDENIVINHQRIKKSNVYAFFEKVLVDELGRLYTLIVTDEVVEIKEWK